MSDQARIIAHRGYSERYPENTLPALQAAIDAGADAVELDVQFCRDSIPVVLHDTTLDRVSGEAGSVADLDFDELQAFSVHEPARLGGQFQGVRIPSLQQAAQALEHTKALVFVEIKSETIPHHTIPQAVDAVLDACKPLGERAIIISFDENIIQEARSLGKRRVGWVLSDWSSSSRERLETIQPDFAFVGIDTLPPTPAPPWEGPWEWAVYEINEWRQAQELARRGFRWIETQAVETLIAGRDGA
jgi:glycerophosphoryl diester phosphodiesterase